jgi:hypothetical protein
VRTTGFRSSQRDRIHESRPRGTTSVEIVQPGTLYGPRIYQMDARVTKIFSVGPRRLQWNFDMFNIFQRQSGTSTQQPRQKPCRSGVPSRVRFGLKVFALSRAQA